MVLEWSSPQGTLLKIARTGVFIAFQDGSGVSDRLFSTSPTLSNENKCCVLRTSTCCICALAYV